MLVEKLVDSGFQMSEKRGVKREVLDAYISSMTASMQMCFVMFSLGKLPEGERPLPEPPPSNHANVS